MLNKDMRRVVRQSIAIFGVLVVTATSASASVMTGKVASTSGPPCNSSFNPYHYTESAVQACGYATYPMLAASDLAGGGSSVKYKVNGSIVTELIPPPGFRPTSASAAQLNEYGFPPRPTNSTQLAAWEKEMSSWTGAAPPTPFLTQVHTHTDMIADTESNNIWAGYVITAQPSSISSFSQAEGFYDEPTFAPSRCASTTEVTWAGLGGWNGASPLAQNGTVWNSNGVDAHQAWWEIVPGFNLMPINYHAIPGELFDASVRVVDTGYRFWFYNFAGNSDAFDVQYTGSTNSATAEVVIERPTVGNTPTNLANFQTLTVEDSEARVNFEGSETTFDHFPPNLNLSTGLWRHGVHMQSNTTGDDLADPGDIGADGAFGVVQSNCN